MECISHESEATAEPGHSDVISLGGIKHITQSRFALFRQRRNTILAPLFLLRSSFFRFRLFCCGRQLRKVVRALGEAGGDGRVQGVVAYIGAPGAGLAVMEELRAAVKDFMYG